MNNVDVLKRLAKVTQLDTALSQLNETVSTISSKTDALATAFKIIAKVESYEGIQQWYSDNEQSPAEGDIFLVHVTENATETNNYNEYLYIGDKFENLGPIIAPVENNISTLVVDVLDSAFEESDGLYAATVTPSLEDPEQFTDVKMASYVVNGSEELCDIKVSDENIIITLEVAKTGQLVLLKDNK